MSHEAALAALGHAERKRFCNLQARAAFRALEVKAFVTGRGAVEFLVWRGLLATFCPTLDQLEAKLRIAGVVVEDHDDDGLEEVAA